MTLPAPVDKRHPVVRFSVNQITTLNWPFERDLELLVRCGVPAVGVSIRKLETCGVGRGLHLLKQSGLGVSCFTSSGLFPLGNGDGERLALERTRRHLETAAAAGAACLMILPGNDRGLSWEEAAARFRPLAEALLADAERCGVRIALEPTSQLRMDLSFLHGFGEALDFVDELDSPWLGVVLEVNNAWIERGLYRNIRERTRQVALVQVNDFKIGTMTASERVVIGDGDIPLRRICRTLDDAGYEGWYDIELLGPAIEAEGYESVVPRALKRFHQLWDGESETTNEHI